MGLCVLLARFLVIESDQTDECYFLFFFFCQKKKKMCSSVNYFLEVLVGCDFCFWHFFSCIFHMFFWGHYSQKNDLLAGGIFFFFF